MRFPADFNDCLQQLVALSKTTKLTIPAIKTMITGKSSTDSFLNIWETVANQKSIGTCANYLSARRYLNISVIVLDSTFLPRA